ncbi:MAG TPA: TonB family protein [Prolixibacteraceae bacterium]
MEAIGLFLLKSAAWLAGFALVFLLFLRNERYFMLNRIYLLGGIVASLLFPLYTFHYAMILPVAVTTTSSIGELSAGEIVTESSIPLYYWIYLAGILAFLFRMLFQTWKIIRKLQVAGYEQAGTIKLVRTPEFATSFSFFSFVFVNPSIAAVEMEEIMNHEREHIQQRHWFDLILVELLCIMQWFNPFVWIYAHLVRQNHEFLADERALQSTTNPAFYQAALLNQLLGVPVFCLTNSFSYSLNKKRFKMMKKKIDSPFRKLKMLAVLPVAAFLFYAFATPEYQFGNDISAVEPQAKSIDVKGQVLKSDGNPLPGTTVILKGSTHGTISDPNGNFVLKGIPSDGELVFSFVGFKSKVQKVDGQPMKIVMEGSQIGLDQVTVVGYGTPPPPPPPFRRFDNENPPLIFLDGVPISKAAMDKLDPETFESINVLKNQTATEKYGESAKNGVLLITTKSGKSYGSKVNSGQKAEQKIDETYNLIKAMNSTDPPLIFLDGVQTTTEGMSQVKPEQIESVSILKDQSGTIVYGEKGKNGVILITTKAKAASQASTGVSSTDQKVEPQKRSDGVFIVVEEMPEFPGGEMALRKYISENIKYPIEAKEKGIQGKVFVTFVVNSTGKVEKAKIARGVDPSLDAEALRVVEQLPEWKPGRQKGEAVSVSYTVPINFALDGNKPVAQLNTSNNGEPQVFVVVEEMPKFPGGDIALRNFLARSVKYPVEAQKNKSQGKVYVSFVVNAEGKVEQAKVEQSVDPLLDAEAIRVVGLMPDWKPGKQRGTAVSVAYTIPIQFKLQ